MKSFHEIEEFWRSMMKLIRGEYLSLSIRLTSFINSDQVEPYLLRFHKIIASSKEAEQHIQNYIDEQKRKFPKLYMFGRDTLNYVFSQIETSAVFEKIKGMMKVTGLIYDKNDPYLTTGAICGDETIHFKSAASSRSSIVDWLRGLDLALSGRLKYDLREFMEERRNLLDDIKQMTSIDQARICAVQIKFWDVLEADNQASLKLHLEHILLQIQESSNLIYHYRLNYQQRAIFNMIVMYTEQRDLLQELLLEKKNTDTHSSDVRYLYNGGTDFILACHIQKKWVSTRNSVHADS